MILLYKFYLGIQNYYSLTKKICIFLFNCGNFFNLASYLTNEKTKKITLFSFFRNNFFFL